MSIINFSNTRQMEGILDEISQVKELIESKINLSRTADREKRASLTTNKVMRICFIVGLSLTTERKEEDTRIYSSLLHRHVSFRVSLRCTIYLPCTLRY